MKKDEEVKEGTCVYCSEVCLSYLSFESTARQRVYIQNNETFSNMRRCRKQTGDGNGTMEFRFHLRSESRFSLRYHPRSMPAIPPNSQHLVPNWYTRSFSHIYNA